MSKAPPGLILPKPTAAPNPNRNAHNRCFRANDPPRQLSIKVTGTEYAELCEIAGSRSLSFAIFELLRIWRKGK